jgi:hypothetical protein
VFLIIAPVPRAAVQRGQFVVTKERLFQIAAERPLWGVTQTGGLLLAVSTNRNAFARP